METLHQNMVVLFYHNEGSQMSVTISHNNVPSDKTIVKPREHFILSASHWP